MMTEKGVSLTTALPPEVIITANDTVNEILSVNYTNYYKFRTGVVSHGYFSLVSTFLFVLFV